MGRSRKPSEALPKNNIPDDLIHSKEFKALKTEMGAAATVEFFERQSHDLKSVMATPPRSSSTESTRIGIPPRKIWRKPRTSFSQQPTRQGSQSRFLSTEAVCN
jgi:hypothetical protein